MAARKLFLFVYGTLKREEPNYFWLRDTNNGYSNYLGIGKTLQPYPLVIATKVNIPFLLPHPGVGHIISGEVFEIDNKMLGRLDILEEHPIYYERRLEPIETDFESKPLQCWAYFLKNFREELLTYPMLASYTSNGDHGLPYLEKSKRDPNYDYKTAVKQMTQSKEED